MLVRRLGVGALAASFALCSTTIALDAAAGDKQLARVKGIVGYEPSPNAPFKAIFGRLDLPDDAVAVTQAGAQAVLRLADSSEIDIGEKTSVQVGAFNAISSGKQNEIVLNGGVLHFNIRHPAGGQSNYKFTTATSQIAVRGTEGFLVSSASGTQVVCVSCAAGDVTIQTGGQFTTIVSGQTATIAGSTAGNASVSVASNTSVSNSSLSQFNSASSTTSSAGTGTAAAGGTSVASGAGGTIATVAGAAGAAGVVAASTNTGGTKSGDTTPGTTPTCGNGTIVAAFVIGGTNSAFASFPQTAQLNAQQPNACSGATFSLTATAAPTNALGALNLGQSVTNGVLLGTATGNVLAPGAITLTLTATDGGSVGPVTINVYGAVTSSMPSISGPTTAPWSQTVTLSQAGPNTSLTLAKSCQPGADLSFTPSSGASPLNVTVNAISAATNPTGTAACTLTVTGSGTGPAASLSIPVNIVGPVPITITNQLRSLPNVKRAPR
jgi:hypothetical protein